MTENGTLPMASPGDLPSFDRVYLASRSPRRRELLAQIGVRFDTLLFRAGQRADPEIDETPRPGEAAAAYVRRLAIDKARHGRRLLVWRKLAARPLLSADTALEVNGDIIGKPAGHDDAFAVLRRLAGRSHRVLTGVAASFGKETKTFVNISVVRFCPLDDAAIRRYVASNEPLDKAGAYAIQGGAGLFVEHISGSFSGIMGLPLYETGLLLKAAGYRFT
ncbi:MAG: Maf family nucleotide pyrophosphatase [Zoogloeaceae bacterium]|jgi:septum formation protein|nr:Maf family nucleotide pyrophosphatase [Zoogloeaceae bacterium]